MRRRVRLKDPHNASTNLSGSALHVGTRLDHLSAHRPAPLLLRHTGLRFEILALGGSRHGEKYMGVRLEWSCRNLQYVVTYVSYMQSAK